MKTPTVKEQVWLCQKTKKGSWTHGLARLKNGMIVVAEIHNHPMGFTEIGHCDLLGAQRLIPDTRRLVICSLYKACHEWLEKNDEVPRMVK